MGLRPVGYRSQYGQDRYVRETFFQDVNDGFFLDIGADDGLDRNNTRVFEEAGWSGICIEPSPSRFPALAKNRSCECLNVAIASTPGDVEFLDITGWGKGLSGIVRHYDARHLERIERETSSNPLTASKAVVRVPAVTLGSILQARGRTPEDNYGDPAISLALAEHGYRLVTTLGQDLVFATV